MTAAIEEAVGGAAVPYRKGVSLYAIEYQREADALGLAEASGVGKNAGGSDLDRAGQGSSSSQCGRV
jgi:hypothetical protein